MNDIRDTKQRAAIRDALNKADRPLNPKEILAIAQNTVPNLGIATVYRNIKTMLERKEIAAIEGSGIAPCYEIPVSDSVEPNTRLVWQVGQGLYNAIPEGFKETRTVTIIVGTIG
jgi:Fe2+ or Zn2+ uptake regulation protein